MTAVEFLREKGIFKEPYNGWVINFHNGIRVDIVKLMEEFVTMENHQSVDPNEMIDHIGDINKMVEISDEEIEKQSELIKLGIHKMFFKTGAKWYREQLKQTK